MHQRHGAVGRQRLEPVDLERLGDADRVPVDEHLRVAKGGIGGQAFGHGVVNSALLGGHHGGGEGGGAARAACAAGA